MNKCYTVLYNLSYFNDSALSENTGKRNCIEDDSCPCNSISLDNFDSLLVSNAVRFSSLLRDTFDPRNF